MKKYSACALALLLLLSLCAPLAAAEEAVIDVPRCAAAPEIDGIIGPDDLLKVIPAIPMIFLGSYLGNVINKRCNYILFRKIVLCFILFISVTLCI